MPPPIIWVLPLLVGPSLAVLAATAPLAAFAQQSSVQLYGIVDAGVR
jgi:hypothetical protein